MERNYSMMLKQLQMAFMTLTMKESANNDACIYCWKNDCGCSNNNVKNDPFINLTAEELKYA